MLQDIARASPLRDHTTRRSRRVKGTLLVSLMDGDHIQETHLGLRQRPTGPTVHVGRQQETHPGAQKARQHWPEEEVDFTLLKNSRRAGELNRKWAEMG